MQQHQQASSTAPSSSTFHRHPLTSMPVPKHVLKHTHTHTTLTAAPSNITLRQHLQQHPERHQHRYKLYTPLWQQTTPCSSTLQQHSNGTTMPAPKRTRHSDSSTHSSNSMPAPKRSPFFGISTNIADIWYSVSDYLWLIMYFSCWLRPRSLHSFAQYCGKPNNQPPIWRLVPPFSCESLGFVWHFCLPN